MELRHLRYFVAVGEEQHFGRAAARLHLAQPVLSRQIQDLEREIRFLLFDRLPRGVRLSAAGTLFLNDARRILQDVEEAKRRAERIALALEAWCCSRWLICMSGCRLTSSGRRTIRRLCYRNLWLK